MYTWEFIAIDRIRNNLSTGVKKTKKKNEYIVEGRKEGTIVPVYTSIYLEMVCLRTLKQLQGCRVLRDHCTLDILPHEEEPHAWPMEKGNVWRNSMCMCVYCILHGASGELY